MLYCCGMRKNKSERRPFADCGSSTASANTACTRLPKGPGKPGSRSIWMRCSPRPWPHAPIRTSTACAWARRAVCASRVAGAGSTASRTSATIPACATSCNSRWKACPTTSPSTWSAGISLAQTWGLPHQEARPAEAPLENEPGIREDPAQEGGQCLKKPLAQRVHQCECGSGPVQRDLYAADLPAYLDPGQSDPSHAQYQRYWESAGVCGEARLRAAWEEVDQRAKEGQAVPRSFGIPRARARLPRSLNEATQEPAFLLTRGRLEA